MEISTSDTTGTPRELEFEVRDRDCFFVAAPHARTVAWTWDTS